jgi:hypothetical protein
MDIPAKTRNMVMGIEIWVLEIRSKIGFSNILAEPELSGLSSLPIFFMGLWVATVGLIACKIN